MTSLVQDVRFALRGLARRPLFAAIVVATIALGIGVNVAIFSVVRGIILRPLPYPDPGRVVLIAHQAPYWLASPPELMDYQRELRTLDALAAYTKNEGNLSGEAEPERVALAAVSPEFFKVMMVAPRLGRPFAADDHAVAPATVTIISNALWRRLGSDPGIVGRTIALNGRPRTVIGVMPEHFDFPTAHTDIWLPMPRFRPDSLGDRANHYLFLVGHVRPGVSVDAATREAVVVARRTMHENITHYDPNQPLVATVTTVADSLVGGTRLYLWTLLGAVGFVLLIVCANVANLLLARGEGRRREIALRFALGADRTRIVAQLTTEGIVLAFGGGLLGLALAWAGDRVLVALAPASIPRLDQIGVDWAVFVYTLAISIAAGLLFAVAPAFRATRHAPAETLKEGGGRASQQSGSHRVRRGLVMAEIALAVVVLSGAGMLLRSLANLERTSLGFEPTSVLTAKVSPTQSAYDESRAIVFYSQLLERVRAIPGVRAAGAAGWLPVADNADLWGVVGEGQSYEHVLKAPTAVPQQATPGYFKAMGIKLRAGREFTDADVAEGPFVAVISRAMAKEVWPDADPIGKRFRVGGGTTFVSVVGVVDDIRMRGFADEPEPMMYFPYPQTSKTAYFLPRSMSLVIRTASGDPLRIANQVRAIVRDLDPTVPASSVRTLEQVVGTSVASRRFGTSLLSGFAALALVLAGIGIFGVVSYMVTERTFEIGVRMALGAERGSVMRLVLSDGLRMAVVGVVIGLVMSVVVVCSIRAMLVGVSVIDPVSVVGVVVVLGVVAVVASVVPARRAMSVEPVQALRRG